VGIQSDHGDIPAVTKDAAEKNKKNKSYDIGYGHKISSPEWSSGKIHGIPFKDAKGNFIPLTPDQKSYIQEEDIAQNVSVARKKGWDKKLSSRGLSWDTLPDKYKLPLEDLAYNVGGTKAGTMWEGIFDSIKSDDVGAFVRNLRRQDSGKNTAGMDNRAARAAKAAGLIGSIKEAHKYGLDKTNYLP
jgi:hypothetical protein